MAHCRPIFMPVRLVAAAYKRLYASRAPHLDEAWSSIKRVSYAVAATAVVCGCSSRGATVVPLAAPVSTPSPAPAPVAPGAQAVSTLSISSVAKATPKPTPLPAPQITQIGGESSKDAGILNGVVAMAATGVPGKPCGAGYDGGRAVNDTTGTYPWKVYGNNFGSAGTASLGGQSVHVIQWSPTLIILDPTLPWNFAPMSTLLKIRTSAGLEVVKGVDVVPAISSRIFGQCTYGVARRRKELGKEPSKYAFDGYTAISPKYIPQVGDQYWWYWPGGKHTGIANRVSAPVLKNGAQTYSVTVYEMDADCRNGVHEFPATFAVKGTTIVTQLRHPSMGDTLWYYR